MPHQCQALVFRCMDFRIKGTVLKNLLEQIGHQEGNYDLVSLAGSCKDLLSQNPSEADFIWKQITLSRKLHHICEIVILYHDHCGAYGIQNKEEEENTQCQDLKIIILKITKKFPEIKIVSYIIKGVENGNLSLQKIT